MRTGSKLLSSPARNQIRACCETHHGVAFYSPTLISGTKGVKNGVKGCPKRYLLHRVDHVTVSRFFLACAIKRAQNIASPKWLPTTYAPGLFEDGCLCSILHGPLQPRIGTAFLLPARLFPTAARQSATQLSHTTFSQLSEHTQESSSTCTLLFPFPLVSRLYIAVLTYTSWLSSL